MPGTYTEKLSLLKFFNGQNYLKSHKSPRKVQLKEVHHSNETASVQVMTPEGVTLVQTNEKKIHKRRPAPPPPPKQPPRRPPPPPPPVTPPLTQVIIENNEELQSTISSGDRLCPSSPDLPLPPPPTAEEIMIVCDDPLPPPPDGTDNTHPRILDSTSLIYPKNSYMSYRSERKLARQGFDGKYRRSFSTSTSSIDLAAMDFSFQDGNVAFSPNTWEQMHNIRQHGTTVIFHSDSLQQIDCLQKSNSQNCILIEEKSQGSDNSPSGINTEKEQLINATKPNNDTQDTLHWAKPYHPSSQERVNFAIENSSIDPLKISSREVLAGSNSVDNFVSVNDSDTNSASSECSLQISENGSNVDHNQNSLQINKIEKYVSENVNENEMVNRVNSSVAKEYPRLRHQTVKTEEELECERLSKEFIHLCGDVEFRNLFVQGPNHKTLPDYLEGLLHIDFQKNNQVEFDKSSENSKKLENNPGDESWNKEDNCESRTKSSEVNDNQNVDNEAELKAKKEELIVSIEKKLESLRVQQVNIRTEMHQNNLLGQEISDRLQELAKPNEAEKYTLHVEELDKIVNLLLSLSGRLARAENNLQNTPKDCDVDEKKMLETKRNKLKEQHEDACRLKECIDRRSNQVTTFLHKYFSDDEYAKYDCFIKRKTKFLIHIREIDEKINLGEEQLAALNVVAQQWKSANS